eukprot:scaffold248277_cov35-Tisochrysis_lutea.AAC.1
MWRGMGAGRVPVLPLRAASTLTHEMSRDEYVQTMARRISYSRTYTVFYITVIFASLVEVLQPGRVGCELATQGICGPDSASNKYTLT